MLRSVFESIGSCLRDGDFAARLGGDEFTLLLAGTDPVEATEVAERVRAAIRSAGARESLTATIGVAPLLAGPRRALLEADVALYRAKARGGDSVAVADTA